MKLTLLGTGSPEPYARRASSGYLIDIGDETLQFDCGGRSYSRLLEAGRMPQEVDWLLLSHLHSDHMLDFAALSHARWDQGAAPLKVCGPSPIARIADQLFSPNGVLQNDLDARINHRPSQEIWEERGGAIPRPRPRFDIAEIGPGAVFGGDGWSICSVEVPHAQPHLTCMGYRIDAGEASLVYSGDSGPCDALTELANGAEVLIHMCFNLSQEIRSPKWLAGSSGHLEVAQTAAAADVGTVILTHLRPHMDAEGVHERIFEEMSEIYGGNIVIGEDLMELEI